MSASIPQDGCERVVYYLCQQVTRQGQGSYAHVNEIIGGLCKRGWRVRLFQPAYAQKDQTPPLAFRLPGMIRAEIDLIFAKPRPDVVYVRSHLLCNLVARWCAWKGIPYVEEVNGSGTDAGKVYPVLRYIAGLIRCTSKWRWRHAAAVIVVTPALKDMISRVAPATDVEVVPTGANTSLFRAPLDEPRAIDVPYVILFGSLAPWHDLVTILAAVELPSWPTSVHLVILGSGRQARLAEEMAQRNSRVIYRPVVPYTDVPVWVGHALAALSLLRTVDGLSASPLKLYESMSCSVPVIVSEAPGQADLVRETGSGLIVPESNPSAVAAAVATLWENPAESAEMGQRGRRAVELSHSWNVRAKQTHEILLRAVALSEARRTKSSSCRG